MIHKYLHIPHREKENDDIKASRAWAEQLYAANGGSGSSSGAVRAQDECADVGGDPSKF